MSNLGTQAAPFSDIRVMLEDLKPFGSNLNRPECILAFSNGRLIVSNSAAAVTHFDPEGLRTDAGSMRDLPNGLAATKSGEIIVANIGNCRLYRLDRAGRESVILDAIDGEPLGSVNFPYVDPEGRLWVTVSTRTEPRRSAVTGRIPDGYVLQFDADMTPRIVLEGLNFPNEIRINSDAAILYIAETSAGRVVKYDLDAEGVPSNPRPHGPDPLFDGALVDGIALDEEGAIWVTEITRHGLIRISPDGVATTVVEDPECKIMSHPTSLTFGGPDRRTVYVGSLDLPHLLTFRSPVAGARMHHWDHSGPFLDQQSEANAT